jgi:hypothetical protein
MPSHHVPEPGAMSLMRPTAQGEVYRQIIDKVILASQTDFEEGGYTQETLQELKMVSHRHSPTLDLARLAWPAASGNLRLHQAWPAEAFFKAPVRMKSGGSGPESRGRRRFGLSHQKERQRLLRKRIAGEPLYFKKALLKPCSPRRCTCPRRKPPRHAIHASALALFFVAILFCLYCH